MSRLPGRRVLVTGASSGIGAAIASVAAAEGARLLLTGRRASPAGLDPAWRYEPGDLGDEAFVSRLVEIARVELGGLDVLVNCHGLQFDADLDATDLSMAREVLDANILATVATMKHAIPLMLEGGRGSVVNIASRLGMVGMAGQAVYSAAKGGLILLSKAAALEYAARGVRINVVAPGLTATGKILDAWSRRADPDEHRRRREATIPMGRLAEPDEIARAVVFLASDEASYVTGAVLPVDGGYTAG